MSTTTQANQISPTAYSELYDLGAHFVLANKDKIPTQKSWQKKRPSVDQVLIHLDKGGLLGIIPASIDCLVIDIDEGDPAHFIELYGNPFHSYDTRRQGGKHLWYFADGERHGNTDISLDEIKIRGDLRCANGYVILWSRESDLRQIHFQIECYKDTNEFRPNIQFWFDMQNEVSSQDPWSKGNRNNTANKMFYQAYINGGDESIIERIEQKAKDSGLSPREIQRTKSSARIAGEKKGTKITIDDDFKGLKTALEKNLQVKGRFNVLSSSNELLESQNSAWEHVDDRVALKLRMAIREKFVFDRSTDISPKFITAAYSDSLWNQFFAHWFAQTPVNPLLEYAKKCADRVKPSMDVLSHWLETVLGAEDTSLNRFMGISMMIALIRRQINPGEDYHLMPILVSERQGIGKSSTLKALLPPELQIHFTDDISLEMNHKEWREAVEDSAIVEFAELAGMNKRELGAVKAFVSRAVDKGRPAYGRHLERRPRRFIFVGTVNGGTGDALLRADASGQRRFIPIQCEVNQLPESPMDAMGAIRDVLWCTAYQIATGSIKTDLELGGANSNKGVGYMHMPAHLQEAQGIVSSEYTESNEQLTDLLGNIISSMGEGARDPLNIEAPMIRMSELTALLEMHEYKPKWIDINQTIPSYLRSVGYRRQKLNSGTLRNKYVWVKT